MGACISVQGSLLKKAKHTHNPPGSSPPKPRSETSKSRRRTPRSSRLITVLKNPSGDDIFKRYAFGKELGRGEFGITYECCDNLTGEMLACKTISKGKLKTEIDVEDVRREVEIMRHLPAHPNIVRYKDVFEDKEAVYLVMELCQGGELFDRIVARGHYTERGAATITKTIIEVVQVCHKHGVIHRDLKPENFLYANTSENSPLKAIDFGLSIFFEPGQHFGEIVGSPYYMAPEVLRRNYGPEIDVWSAGVILYILLCGVPPFWAESEEGIAQAIVRGEIDFERDPWTRVSEDAKDLVKGMLDPNPYSRMTVEEVLEHRWIYNADQVPNIPLGENVRARIKQFSLMNKFKKKVLRVVADNLPQEEVAGIKQVFHMMDTDKNGNLSFEELKDGLHMIGQPVADPEVQMLMDAADFDGNGMLNCEEFVTMSVHLKKIGSDDELLRQAFRHFDKDESGYIEYEELREGLSEENLGPNNDQVIQDIIYDVDLDKDGRISYQEFEAMMTMGVEWRMASRQYSRAMLNKLSQRLFKDKSVRVKNETTVIECDVAE
ncbi:calcium-dependent protein kinase 24-like [Rhododendron vialii]|uniref:calcium-dependent protein kinase 24-like n=1 Tax=Rhododendron vialii TaxID=182163 RepID=UPI00265F54F6|nr:calcium-dependent protein kinase 24-like [Rhododendron vialii]